MRKIYLYIIYIAAAALAVSCENNDVNLKLKNNSKYAVAFDSALDTIPDSVSIDMEIFLRGKIDPGKTVTMIKPGDSEGWLSLIQNSTNNKLNVFIMSADTLQKYNDWNLIRKNHLYKRYEYTEAELNKMNWVIEFP